MLNNHQRKIMRDNDQSRNHRLPAVEPAVDIGLWVSRGQHHHLPVFLLLLIMVVDLKTEVEVILL